MFKLPNFVSILFITIFIFNTMIAKDQNHKANLMPYPAKIVFHDGKYRIDESIDLTFNLDSERLQKRANKTLERLAKRTGLFLENPFAKLSNNNLNKGIHIFTKQIGLVKLGVDESYNLVINNSGIEIVANTDIGAIRGIETLLQLLNADKNGYYFPNVEINDKPRFPWRGLMIDICRHYMPIEVIKRNLDAMAAVKMNVFHWHLSEDQGFRVESKVFPKLHELGSDGLYYTQKQVKEIIGYADDLGIRVVPEFDVPGHATAILAAYQELASAPGPYEIERDWGIFDPTLDPTNNKTYVFLGKLFKEMAALFPDEYFHIGGDENNGKQWDNNENIQKFIKENNLNDNHELQGYFNKKLLKILTEQNKKMVGWDEILHPSMPNNIVIQSWRGKKALIESAKKGYQAILSNGYYIDLMQSTEFHYQNDPISEDADLTESERKLILGGEATMWAEMISDETIDSRIWPRTAAIAERFWSPQEINDTDDMYNRLDVISYQLEEHGLTHIKNYDMMLRRLTNNNSTEALRTLISVIEPVKIYNRYRLRPQTQQTPLSRVVDASTADAKAARLFRKDVDNLLSKDTWDKNLSEKIKQSLLSWKNNYSQLYDIIDNSPILNEIELMSKKLHDISVLGLEIIRIKEELVKVDSKWITDNRKIIEASNEPVAQTELMIVSAIDKLLESIN